MSESEVLSLPVSNLSDEEAPLVPVPEVAPPRFSFSDKYASFEQFPVSSELRQAIAELGFTRPTDVQGAVVADAVAGRDMLVQSKTGSGKTSAFGIPLVERLTAQGAGPHMPHGLVLCPTRELAHQVAAELRALGGPKGIRVVAVYGGVPMGRQIAALKAGADIVVGTPGRLLDHLRRKNMALDKLQIAVLDEADEMLSMGFWDDVTDLLKLSPDTRQTMLFSATLPYEVAKAAAQFMREPVKVDLSADDLTVSGIQNCIVHVVPDVPKPRQLLYLLETVNPESTIIFCNTRNETDMIAKYLTQAGFEAEPLSGSFKQKERERVMARIKGGELRYMVATDIAARGIDINDLSHVMNYSLPEFSEVYLHRVGRTGRIGKMGTAVSLVDGKGLGTLTQLEREFGVKFVEMTLPPEEEVVLRRSKRIMKELSEKASVAEIGQHLPVAQEILSATDAPHVVAYLLKSYFATQADNARRPAAVAGAVASSAAPAAPRISQPRHNHEHSQNDAGAEGAEGRRRRRGRRGRRGGAGRNAPAQQGGMETIDMRDVLNGDSQASSSAPSRREPSNDTQSSMPRVAAQVEAVNDGMKRIRVNIGFDDGFKGRGAVAKKISALAGLNEGIITEVESRRDHAVLKATPEIASLVLERVDGAQVGKKVITVQLAD